MICEGCFGCFGRRAYQRGLVEILEISKFLPGIFVAAPPLGAPSGSQKDPFFSPRFGTGIRTASRASFATTPRRPRAGRGAPEQVNYRVNSMSTISLPGRSGVAPGPLLESQPAPLGSLFRVTVRLQKWCGNGSPPGGEKGQW